MNAIEKSAKQFNNVKQAYLTAWEQRIYSLAVEMKCVGRLFDDELEVQRAFGQLNLAAGNLTDALARRTGRGEA